MRGGVWGWWDGRVYRPAGRTGMARGNCLLGLARVIAKKRVYRPVGRVPWTRRNLQEAPSKTKNNDGNAASRVGHPVAIRWPSSGHPGVFLAIRAFRRLPNPRNRCTGAAKKSAQVPLI